MTGGVGEQPPSPKQPFCGRVPTSPSVSYAECTSFSSEKKRKQKIRKPTRLDRVSTQASPVKRGLRLWKQQPKQSPPFSKLSPTHQQTAALQLLEVTPIRQAVPLLNKKEATLTAFKTCPSRDGFAWRVKMTPYMILLLTFLIPGEKLVPCRGMSGNEGMWDPSHKKGCLGEEGLPPYSPRHFVTPPSRRGAD